MQLAADLAEIKGEVERFIVLGGLKQVCGGGRGESAVVQRPIEPLIHCLSTLKPPPHFDTRVRTLCADRWTTAWPLCLTTRLVSRA